MSEADAVTEMVDETVALLAGEVMEVVGGVVSGICVVLPNVEDDCPEILSAASNAVKAYEYVLLGARPTSVKIVPLEVAT